MIVKTDFYRITVYGGSGGYGGRGAKVVGTFKLIKGTSLKAITGSNGIVNKNERNTSPTLIHGSSGGDASVVYIQKSPDEWKPLIVAGGGGGWCSNNFPYHRILIQRNHLV